MCTVIAQEFVAINCQRRRSAEALNARRSTRLISCRAQANLYHKCFTVREKKRLVRTISWLSPVLITQRGDALGANGIA